MFTINLLDQTKKMLHIIVTLVGCGLTVSGTIRKFSGREKHFVTLHGRLGRLLINIHEISTTTLNIVFIFMENCRSNRLYIVHG